MFEVDVVVPKSKILEFLMKGFLNGKDWSSEDYVFVVGIEAGNRSMFPSFTAQDDYLTLSIPSTAPEGGIATHISFDADNLNGDNMLDLFRINPDLLTDEIIISLIDMLMEKKFKEKESK